MGPEFRVVVVIHWAHDQSGSSDPGQFTRHMKAIDLIGSAFGFTCAAIQKLARRPAAENRGSNLVPGQSSPRITSVCWRPLRSRGRSIVSGTATHTRPHLSGLKMSATTFHCLSDCFCHTTTYLPITVVGVACGSFTFISYVPTS
jgi:hypothetical protein